MKNLNDKQQIPASFRKSQIVYELGIETWKSIFKLTEEEIIIDLEDLTHKHVSDFLCKDQVVSQQLISALDTIFELGDDAGRELIEQASIDAGIDLGISDNETSRELSARIWLISQKDEKFLSVLSKADAALKYSRKSSNIREYVGESGIKIERLENEKIKVLVSAWCKDNNKHEVVDIHTYKIGDFFYCDIVRGDHIKQVSEIIENRQSELRYRPAVCDHIRVEPDTGRIGIIARSTKLVSAYRNIFGKILTNNPDYFSGENICSLSVLQESGAKVFENDKPSNLQSVRVTELKWRRGNSDTIIVRGRDCFRILNDLEAKLQVGELIEAKLAFAFFGENRPVRVFVKVPGCIKIPEGEYEGAIARYLTKVGIRGRFDNDIKKKNFWSLSHWAYSETEWRRQIGGDFDKLKKQGFLGSVDLDAVKHPDHSSSAGALTVEQNSKNDYIGVGDDNDFITLTATDRDGYKLDISKLCAHMSDFLSLTGGVAETVSGLWSLGNRSLSAVKIHVFLATSPVSKESLAVINQQSNGCRSVVIMPEGCSCDISTPVAYSDILSLNFDDLIFKIVQVLQVQDQVDPPLWLSEDLILDCKTGRSWYLRRELKNLDPATHPFKFAKRVIEAGGNIVPKDSLNVLLSPSSHDGKVASKAKSDFIKKLEEVFIVTGEQPPEKIKDIFRSKAGGYAINCTAKVISREVGGLMVA